MKIQKIRKVWYDYNSNLGGAPTKYNLEEVSLKLASFFCPGPFYFYIFDFGSYQFDKMSSSYEEIIGLSSQSMTIDQLLSSIHPDDVDFFAQCESHASRFLFDTIDASEILNYKISYCVRIRTANQAYKLFLHQAMGVTLNGEGKLGKVLGVHCDISQITTINNRKLSFFGTNGSKSYIGLDVAGYSKALSSSEIFDLTPREIQILRLLSEGATAKEMADILFISPATARKHRENILRKTKSKNTTHLVAKAIRNGLI